MNKSTNQTPTASASRHTPEPWNYAPDGNAFTLFHRDDNIATVEKVYCLNSMGGWTENIGQAKANASRIVACVNALAGMEPGAVAALVVAVERYLQVNTVGNRNVMRAALAALKGGAK